MHYVMTTHDISFTHAHAPIALVVKDFILQQFALKIDKHPLHAKAIVLSIVLS